jgi:site-specific recombinase XerD
MQPSAIVLAQPAPARHWLDYFSLDKAVASVAVHVASLPSSRTPEQTTKVAYMGGLKYLTDWLEDEMPTPATMQRFIAHLTQRGLASSTINARYLAPARHYLRALADQHQPGLTGETRDFMADCAMEIRKASESAPAKRATTTRLAPLWNPKFKRLSLEQVNAVLERIKALNGLIDLRDYALIRVAVATGLRLAELARITLASIQPLPKDEAGYLLSVRGKRSNLDPVALDVDAYKSILRWVLAFNRAMSFEDPRRIVADVPVWQPVHRYNRPYPLGSYDPCKGLSHQAMRDLMGDRTQAALGKDWRLSPHDFRRTAAALAYEAGMALEDIQAMLRHSDISTTMKYIGVRPDYARRTLARLVTFN